MTFNGRRLTVLLIPAVILVGLCAVSPFGRLFLQPIRPNFDSRYSAPGARPVPFDQARWQSGPGRNRVAMAHYLIEEGALFGKTSVELLEMLGKPDFDEPGQERMRWLLGFYAKGLFDESLWLDVDVETEGKVRRAAFATDWHDPRER
jgi:hypothetical protein